VRDLNDKTCAHNTTTHNLTGGAMNPLFKKRIIKQLSQIEKDVDVLLNIEGNISDLRDLPPMLTEKMQELQNWSVACRISIENLEE
jgi:hypothetical protein